MGKNLSYYDLAENDYQFLLEDYNNGRVGNLMCSTAQNICEKYFKHVIDEYCSSLDTTAVLRTHSLRSIRNFLKNELPEFTCDWNCVLQADGYYFSARYPGDDAFIVDKDDVDECWAAVEAARMAVNNFITRKE